MYMTKFHRKPFPLIFFKCISAVSYIIESFTRRNFGWTQNHQHLLRSNLTATKKMNQDFTYSSLKSTGRRIYIYNI